MKPIVLLLCTTMCLIYACKQSEKTPPVAPRDQSITPANSYSELFFDSMSLEKFIAGKQLHDSLANRMRSFYNSRNYQHAWFFNDGAAPYIAAFRQMVDEYVGYSRDSLLNNEPLWKIIDSLDDRPEYPSDDSTVLLAELSLTQQFFRYASRAYQGRWGINVTDLGWYIPRKRINSAVLLDSFIKRNGKEFAQSAPVNRQYNLLKNFLLKYYDIEKSGNWQPVKSARKTYQPGDTSETIAAIKMRLQALGDLNATDTGALFTDSLKEAVKSFQLRHGLNATGAINTSFLNELNRPIGERIRQILINMERLRWVPVQPVTDYLLVNIPEFRLHVYEKGEYRWSMNVVVGSAAHNTVIFTGTLQNIVFSPYWNVPPGIYKNEILPAMQRNPNYLAAHNMEKYGNSVRQKPGPNNALGLVKFLFPNSYNIYLHDSPAKDLFKENSRAFSHGCIRLSDPKKLAQFLLRNDSAWDSKAITKAMNARKEKYVTVQEPIPVFIGYFTVWVDREGKLNFRKDLYGHDQKTAAHLFGTRQMQ